MAAAPRYKVFDQTGKYVASTKTPVLGIAVANHLGLNASVRDGKRVKQTIWKNNSNTPMNPGEITAAARDLPLKYQPAENTLVTV